METDKLDKESKTPRASTQHLCVVPQDIGRFGSALDIASSAVDIRFSLSEDATFCSVWPQILACTSAASFHLAAGSTLGFSAILIPQLEAKDSEIKVSKEDISWIASVVPLVVPLGALVTGYLVDRIGRINTIKVSTLPFLIGWVCIALAQDLRLLLIGRLLTGFSAAMGTSPAVVYITEIARSDLRGALVCMAPSLTSLGMVVMYSKGAVLYWRTVAWLSLLYCVLPLLFITLWSPESPVWLISKNRTEDALKSLSHLLKNDKKGSAAELQLGELIREHNSRQQGQDLKESSFKKLIHGMCQPAGYKPLILLTIIFASQQFSGIYITIFYAVSFFKDVGAEVNPYVSSVGVGMVRLVIGLLTAFLLKTHGRRPLFLISCTGMTIFMVISGYFTREVEFGRHEPTLIPVICILLYMSLGVIGLLSIPWTMTAELFALEIRGMAQGLIISLAHILMFAALKVYPFLKDMLGGAYAVQWLFASVSLASVLFIFVFLPETHNKELSEIQDYFKYNTVYICRKRTPANLDSPEIRIQTPEQQTKLKDSV